VPVATARRDEWIGIEQLAEEIGIPVRTIYGWRSRSEGPVGYRIGRHVRFRRADVDAWLEQHRDPRTAA
jgi:excisionase family DNA binding protein